MKNLEVSPVSDDSVAKALAEAGLTDGEILDRENQGNMGDDLSVSVEKLTVKQAGFFRKLIQSVTQ